MADVRAFAVAVAGQAGKPCEDAAWASPLMLVVADGLGSTGRGAVASALAVSTADTVLSKFASWGTHGEGLTRRLTEIYRTEATRPGTSTTCLCAWFGPKVTTIGWVGDGLILVKLASGEYAAPIEPRDNFANETESLPRHTLRWRTWPTAQVEAVLMATDGVSEDLTTDAPRQLLNGFGEMLWTDGEAPTQIAVRDWLTNWRTPNSNDDRSFALWARRPHRDPGGPS